MSTDSVINDDTGSASLPADETPADVTDVSCAHEFPEVVPLPRDADGPCTTDCDGGDRSAQVKRENLLDVKQVPNDVCFIV